MGESFQTRGFRPPGAWGPIHVAAEVFWIPDVEALQQG